MSPLTSARASAALNTRRVSEGLLGPEILGERSLTSYRTTIFNVRGSVEVVLACELTLPDPPIDGAAGLQAARAIRIAVATSHLIRVSGEVLIAQLST